MTGARSLLAAPLLLLVARLIAPLPRSLGRADYAAFVVLGLSGLVANTTVWYLRLKHTTALNAGIGGASWPRSRCSCPWPFWSSIRGSTGGRGRGG